jgi:two-component system sensor histidine kinase DegS
MINSASKLLEALENERRYIARELHDGVAQTTLQLGLEIGICRKLLEHNKLDLLTAELARLEERIQTASGQVRELIADLRPPQVEPEADLSTRVRQQIDLHLERGGPPVEDDISLIDPGVTLSGQQTLALTRVVQEALLNVRKHAHASQINVRLCHDDEQFGLIISDNGRGFDPSQLVARPTERGGAGLANLQVRVEAIGGKLNIESDTTGQGTTITVTLPR